jgi:hypothetical protein
MKRYEDALAAYNEAIRLYPLLREAHTGKVKMLSKLKRYEDVLVACREAKELEVKNYGFDECRAEALYALKRYDELIEIGERETARMAEHELYKERRFSFLHGGSALYIAHALRARLRYDEACEAYRGGYSHHFFYESAGDNQEEYDAYLEEARKGERTMLLLLGRFREAIDENYRENRRFRKYFANRPSWPPFHYESDPPDEED